MSTTTATAEDGTRTTTIVTQPWTEDEKRLIAESIERDKAEGDAWEANRDHCPNWCDHHELVGVHSHVINVGPESWVAIEQVENPSGVDKTGPCVVVPDLREGVQGDNLRDLIAALVEARRIIGNA